MELPQRLREYAGVGKVVPCNGRAKVHGRRIYKKEIKPARNGLQK
jgi:hypothetical protein